VTLPGGLPETGVAMAETTSSASMMLALFLLGLASLSAGGLLLNRKKARRHD
jgi:hypothetical protein